MNKKSDYPYLQENGQLKYGGPPSDWEGPPPPKGTEVFVSRLPRDASLPEICSAFGKIGKIYAARLMMDFSGTNRGFCFIQYRTKTEAKMAISKMNGYEIRSGSRVSVTKSIDNCRLFIGQVPKELRKEDIKDILETVTSGVKDVILYLSPTDKSVNRGFCFVEYYDHRSAAMARRTLISGGIPDWGREVRIDWAIPEDDIDEDIMSQVTVVYIRNLMLRTSEQSLKDVICKVVPPSEVTRIRKVKDFAFVHFKERQAAEKAIVYLDGFILDGANLIATWAKPTPPEDCKIVSPNGKKDKKKIDFKKKFETFTKSSDVLLSSKQYHSSPVKCDNNDKSLMNYQGSPQVYISTALSPAHVPSTLPYSSVPDSHGVVYPPYGYQSPPSPVNTVTVVPYIFPSPSSNTVKENAIKSVVDTYLNSYSPAVALRYIVLRLGWGEVYFNIDCDMDINSRAVFSAQVIIVNQDRTVQYPPVHHPPTYSPYDAKNMAAICFIKTYILLNQSSSAKVPSLQS